MARVRLLVVPVVGAVVLLAANSAMGALPRTYQVQRVDSPTPVAGGDFGIGFVNVGDVNRDGRDDLLVGTDEHGGSTGPVYVISGADGSQIRSITAPDPDPGATGDSPAGMSIRFSTAPVAPSIK